MNRIWVNYNLWEDWKEGLYSKEKQSEMVEHVARFLKNDELFFDKSVEMVKMWPNAMNQNLSYEKSNRKSYIGQAASCYYLGANIMTTCKAWETLTKEERENANHVAARVIDFYDKEIYPKFIKNTGDSNEELS